MNIDFELDHDVPGVPMRSVPVYWDADKSPDVNLAVIGRQVAKYNEMLPAPIDEVAVLLPSEYARDHWIDDLAHEGWVKFNDARDVVATSPFGTRYMVSYVFLRKEGVPFRIEAMCIDLDANDHTGFSPLHYALMGLNGYFEDTMFDQETRMYPIVHLSFKPIALKHEEVLTGEALVNQRRRSYSRTVQHLKDKAFIHAMSCQSSYGQFSYWLHQDEQKMLYVKPRVNTRDDG